MTEAPLRRADITPRLRAFAAECAAHHGARGLRRAFWSAYRAFRLVPGNDAGRSTHLADELADVLASHRVRDGRTRRLRREPARPRWDWRVTGHDRWRVVGYARLHAEAGRGRAFWSAYRGERRAGWTPVVAAVVAHDRAEGRGA